MVSLCSRAQPPVPVGHFHEQEPAAGTVKCMYTVEASAVLSPGRYLAEEEITDLIEAVIDDLDTTTTDPSVSTVRDGADVRIAVSVTVDSGDQFTALATAAEAMVGAFCAAGVAAEGITAARDLHSEVRSLQAV
jgi:hypothetical protein